MNNNLDDFFKKKLGSDLSSDGWDEPSEQVWERAQSGFPIYPQKRQINWLVVSLILLGFGLMGSVGYIDSQIKNEKILNEEIILLKKELNQQEMAFSNLTEQNLVLQEECSSASASASNDIQTLQQSLKTSLKENSTAYQNTIRQQKRITEDLINKNAALVIQNEALQKEIFAASQESVTATVSKDIDKDITDIKKTPLVDLDTKSLIVDYEVTKEFDFPVVSLPKKTWKKYEVGLTASSLTFDMAISNNFENISNLQSEASYYIADATAYSLHFGYAPFEDFYVRTGVRHANFFIDNSFISGLIYDADNEYINNDGNVANDLLLKSSTSYNNIEQAITVEIPNGITLETGDVLISTLTNYQTFSFLQIPLGVAYYRGKKRWQWEFQGGLTWNKVSFGDYQFQASFQANDIEIPTDGFNTVHYSEVSNQYLGGYLGVGANYRLSNKWQARLGLLIEETGRRTNATDFPRRFLLESSLSVGLNYRF